MTRWLFQQRQDLCPVLWLLSGLLKSALSAVFRFDTYRFRKESERLVQYLNAVPNGRILSVAVNDEGSRNLDDTARKAMTKLGSKHFLHLGFRYLPSPHLHRFQHTEAALSPQFPFRRGHTTFSGDLGR